MDYANRKRPAKRKPAPQKRKSNAKSQRQVPWGVVVLAVLLVAALVGGLRFIAGGKSDEATPPAPQQATDTPDQSAEVVAEPMPEKPQERWQYIEELENLEVEVDVPERELGPPKLMQCGSFRKQADAERLRAAIALQGLESKVYPSNNNTWYRVVLGPYETKRDAEADRHKLQRARIHGCQIWNWNL
ncbi:Cell division protein FtsN [Pseudidiomarina piscicola]|uniref:Cell division protein FtsN n=1 Tax=Pseudidiomarina piscicola TaxID=2614830 RepID=A0A6S6WPF0_9GAMM|nr:SPOR domain-containing protein [Pseudidiomarina piscicola]CAB0151430.1 Cell division protein FtsN [Pseudidiomarina piscicola]VZT40909.1 Cell division protein FtsN [Pseudomonas aeruginosa]